MQQSLTKQTTTFLQAVLGGTFAASCFLPMSPCLAMSVSEPAAKNVSLPFVDAAKKATPSVVSIKAQIKTPRFERMQESGRDLFQDEFWERFFGMPSRPPRRPQQEPRYGFGSGFIVSEDGYIMTNNHLIENSNKITVQLSNGKEYIAKVIGADPATDIALLKIQEKGLPSLHFADSSRLDIGEWIVVIGNPLALRTSVSAGVVSALGRNDLEIMRVEEFIQTDAAINRGNSGGPVINLEGDVVGMATAILSSNPDGGNIGIGFAISSNLLKEVMQDIIEHGQPTRGYLGFMPQTIDDDMAQALGLPMIQGALIAEIAPNSPAETAGLKEGDVILQVNGVDITSAGGVRRAIAMMKPGQKATLAILRNGQELSIQATIGTNPSSRGVQGNSTEDALGVIVEPITPELQKQYNLDTAKGLIVVDVDMDGGAYDAGIRPGCIILSINGTSVTTREELHTAIEQAADKKQLLLQVKIGHTLRFIPLKLRGNE